MYPKKTKKSLEQHLYYSFFFISTLVILLSLGITLYYDINRQRRDVDTSISGTAAYIASMPDVISMLEAGYPSPLAKQDLDSLCANISDISVVVICDKNSLRFYHTDRQKTGESFVDGDETKILSGSEPYITTGFGTKGSQRRAFHSIKSSNGEIIGFVMASVFTAHISGQQRTIILVHIAILGFMLLISFILTRTIVHFLRKSLMGFYPDELLDLYIRQDELLRVTDELSGTRCMLDTLRSVNHEFLNKLHIILGYLQTGATQKAIDFIINSNLVSSEAIRQTADSIRVSRICALLIGKMMHAAELGILLTLTHDSCCIEKDLLIPMESYITLIGNLLENAIEELSSKETEVKEIKLGIYCRPDCNVITCEDTGSGITPELMEHIFEKGCSSKGENRGTGLYLIHEIIEENHGDIVVDTEDGEGTCFTITFTGKEGALCTM
ncbi:MAG: ATP-binding protein [Clostridium sp.]